MSPNPSDDPAGFTVTGPGFARVVSGHRDLQSRNEIDVEVVAKIDVAIGLIGEIRDADVWDEVGIRRVQRQG